MRGERQVGVVTSGSFAPTLGTAVAMAMVDGDVATAGTAVEGVIRDSRQPAVVTPLPFYQRDKRGA
jgi:aminomethyltransferase